MGRRRFRRVDLDGRLRLHACAGKNRENIQRRGGADSGNLFQEKNLLPKYPAPVCPGACGQLWQEFPNLYRIFYRTGQLPRKQGQVGGIVHDGIEKGAVENHLIVPAGAGIFADSGEGKGRSLGAVSVQLDTGFLPDIAEEQAGPAHGGEIVLGGEEGGPHPQAVQRRTEIRLVRIGEAGDPGLHAPCRAVEQGEPRLSGQGPRRVLQADPLPGQQPDEAEPAALIGRLKPVTHSFSR